MLQFFLRRLGQSAVVAFAVSIIVFLMIHLIPGDPVDAIFATENVSDEEKQEYRAQLGLDQPLWVQYAQFIGSLLRGDLGQSLRRNVAVGDLIGATFPATIELTLAALIIAVVISVPIAIVSALRQGSVWDRGGSIVALLGISLPSFWLGIVLILLFSVAVQWFPVSGRVGIDAGYEPITGFVILDSLVQGNWDALASSLWHLVLPAVTLGTAVAATLVRVLRSSLLEVKSQDFIEALTARGLPYGRVVTHMVRNALPASVTVMGLRIGGLLGGAVVIEAVFSWPGVGLLTVEAISGRDYPVIQAAVLVLALAFVGINFLTDVIHGWLDPRVKLQKKASA